MGNPFQTPGAISWHELLTGDVEAAKAFYAGLLGWEMETDISTGTEYTVVKAAGQPMGGMMRRPPECPPDLPPHWGIYITVEDVDATAAKAGELGGQVIHPAQDIPGVGRFAVLSDPQGAAFTVIKYASGT
ncbi:MAG TPA: VOC family protein [Phycisphaerae bacterium]|nr:VOC family protein [Phycisphaerae bacterium]